MALHDILEKIRKDAEKRIAEIETDFNKKRKTLDEKNREEKNQLEKNIERKVEENGKNICEKIETLGEMEEKTKLLQAKRAIIDAVLEKTVEELSNSDKVETILIDMLRNIDLPENDIEIIPAKGIEEVTRKAIHDSGKNYRLSGKTHGLKGGFIVQTPKIDIDNTFETLIKKDLREDLEIELGRVLFA